jgi:predicted nucleotidyltransferase
MSSDMNISDKQKSFGWDDCPTNISAGINGIIDSYRIVLKDNLVGFYLHGSLAMGCFNPGQSDVDFLAVVYHSLARDEMKSIIKALLEVNLTTSPIVPEMSVVLLRDAVHPVYPTPYELHYSSSWRECYLADEVDWDARYRDEDLVLHFLAVKRRGICLFGRPIEQLFPEPPRSMYIASILNDLDWIYARLSSLPPTYPVLNPCRALAFLRTDAFMSKKEGGIWALSNVPGVFSSLITYALAVYQGSQETVPDQHRIIEFFEYVRASSFTILQILVQGCYESCCRNGHVRLSQPL